MKNLRFLIALGVGLGLSAPVLASHNPVSANQDRSAWAPGLQDLVINRIVNNNGNAETYFFMVSDNGGESLTQNQATDSSSGHRVITSYNFFGSNGAQFGRDIFPIRIGTPYFVYIESCESGTPYTLGAIDNGICSDWVLLNGGSISTLPSTTNPGFNNINAASITGPTSMNATMKNPIISDNSAQNWTVKFTQQGTANTSGDLPNPFTSNSGPYALTVTDAYFSGQGTSFRLVPNTAYILTENILYNYNQRTTNYTPPITPFWTNPADPVALAIDPLTVTHCSAVIPFQNTTANPANPNNTVYTVIMGGGISSQSKQIGGTGIFSDANSIQFTSLTPGTHYSPNVLANNLGGPTWNPSNTIPYTGGFTTKGTNGSFSISNITTTSADFTFPAGFDTSGAVSWQRVVNGVLTGPVTNGLPPTTIAFTGLTPNTHYTVQVRVNEASCNYTVPPVALAFTTTPNVPQTFVLSATGPRQLSATWTTNGNPGATTYQVQYCLDNTFTTGCQTLTTGAGATSATLSTGVVPETPYFAHVRALTVGGGLNSGYSNSDSATTPNEAPVVNTATCSAPTGAPSASTCGGTGTDNGPTAQLRCHWTAVSPGGQSVSFAPAGNQTPTGSPTATCPNVTATFTGNGSYQLTLHFQDADGTGLEGTKNVSVVVGPQPFSVTVAGGQAQVATGATSANYTATVLDQFGNDITGSTIINWAATGAGNSMVPATGTQSAFHAGVTVGSFNITASAGSVTSAPKQINVVAAGAHFTSGPTLTINTADYKTGTLMATGTDNVLGTAGLTYTWALVSGPGSISVSPNGTTASGNATVTFSKAGQYVVSCVLRNANGASAPSNTAPATVPQVLSSIGVTPNNVTISLANRQMFALQWRDQFGSGMPTGSVNWTATGGSVSGAGVFQSGSLGNNIIITATATSPNQLGQIIHGAATVNIVDYDVSGAKAYPVPFKSTQSSAITFTGLGSDAQIRIYSTSGRLVFSTHVTSSNGQFSWAVVNSSSEKLASGVYLYVIESPTTTKHGKLIIIQ